MSLKPLGLAFLQLHYSALLAEKGGAKPVYGLVGVAHHGYVAAGSGHVQG